MGGTQIETGKEEYCGGKVAMDELNVPCIFLYVRTLLGAVTAEPIERGERTMGGKYFAPYMSSASSDGSISSTSSPSRSGQTREIEQDLR